METNVNHLKEKMDLFIKSLPDFIEESKRKGPFNVSHKELIVFYGNITEPIMKEWCKIASENFFSFKWGDIYDHDNLMYENWTERWGYIYVTAKYSSFIYKDPLDLTWGFMGIKDGE